MARSIIASPGRAGVLIAVVLLAVTAGCAGVVGDGGSASSDGDLVEYAPADSNVLVHVDGDVVSDRETRMVWRASRDESDTGIGTVDLVTVLSVLQRQTDVDLGEFEAALLFGNGTAAGDGDRSGVIVRSEWRQETVSEWLESSDGGDYESSTYAGGTLYQPSDASESTSLGAIGNGTFVLGSERSVKAVLDVAAGNRDAVSGPLVEEYAAASGGLVTIAVTDPDDSSVGTPEQVGRTSAVDALSLSYATPNGVLQSEAEVVFENRTTARIVEERVSEELTTRRRSASNETVAEYLSNVEVSTDGPRVVVAYSVDADAAARQLERLGDVGETEEPTDPTPTLVLDWQATADGDVVVTHAGGDTVRPANLVVVNGHGERLNTTMEGDPLTTGDTITVRNGTSHEELRLVRVTEDFYSVLGSHSPDDAESSRPSRRSPASPP